MNRLLKGGLAVACGAVAAEAVRRMVYDEPRPKYAPWERRPFKEFANRILVVGGGFAGYTLAKTLGELTRERDAAGIMGTNKENFLTYRPMVCGGPGGEGPGRTNGGARRRRNHGNQQREFLHLLADGGGDHKQRRGDQEHRSAPTASPGPVRGQLPAGGAGGGGRGGGRG